MIVVVMSVVGFLVVGNIGVGMLLGCGVTPWLPARGPACVVGLCVVLVWWLRIV